ncbi:protein HIRA/HIR1 [Nematocida sp. LUAm3]|nr:protein HIRA/HIR1 [Nematocida sp. LUAm3]KAI5175716.1 protein HIRA/HIR1 [Nematocida sp. LUAm2]KAI5178622.1 protein HIRA/HIR1 [Nematocida sp. LUAm1]
MKIILTSAAHLQSKKRCPVFSVDTWPKNKEYLVSGAQDGVVALWRIHEQETKEVEKYQKHMGSVLCVRFNEEGSLLATASDDGNVLIWGVEEKENTLHFSCKRRIADHRSDVSSLSWSNKYLATGGYDGFVFVYDAQSLSLVKRLERHEKGCKGVSFSPKGKYLTTYGDEGELFLYSKELQKLSSTKKPFKGPQMESFFERMSWSPDAKYVACGLSFVDRRNAVAILSVSLNREYTLVGHASPVEVSSFNPKAWKKNQKEFYLLATGSQDRSIAIWSSFSPQPLFLLKEVSEQPIIDLRWSNDGLSLVGCSYDGSIFLISFSQHEIGESFSPPLDQGSLLAYSKDLLPKEDIPLDKIKEFPSLQVQEKEENIDNPEKDIIHSNIQAVTNNTPEEPQPEKRKLIPKLISPLKVLEDKKSVKGERVVLYLPQEHKQTEEKEFPLHLETEYQGIKYFISIEKEKRTVKIKRNGDNWFKINGLIAKGAAAHGPVLLIIAENYEEKKDIETIWIYNLEKCIMIIPALAFQKVITADVLGTQILIVSHKRFKIIDLQAQSSIEDEILDCGVVVSVTLHEKYFLLALYENGSTLMYNHCMRMWCVLEVNGPSIYSDAYKGELEKDCTFEELENTYIIKASYNEWIQAEVALERLFLALSNSSEPIPELINRVDGISNAYLLCAPDALHAITMLKSILLKSTEENALKKYVHYKIKELDSLILTKETS